MANIITNSDFKTDIKIANKSDVAVNEDLTNFITEREPEFLGMLFGSEFAALFVAGVAGNVTRFTALLTPRFRKAIATFIWYYYERDQNEQIVGIGTVKTNPANALLSSPRNKMLKVWFEMAKTCWQMQQFLKDDSELPVPIYPEWVVPSWYKIFSQQWMLFSFGWGIFLTDYYFSFGRRYCVPDIYYPLSRL